MNIPGKGIAKGYIETAKNLFGSYVDKERLTTVSYPEEKIPAKENARNFPFLVFDKEPLDGLRCVACSICEKECPPQCIYIVKDKDENGKAMKRPKIFDIDVSVCMSCQICVEVCPFDAIKMDTAFELSGDDRFEGLLLKRDELAKSNEYYHSIHPTEAANVDAQLEAERKKKEAAKRAKEEAARKKAEEKAKAAAEQTKESSERSEE